MQSEERYRELFENANDVVYTHDLAGNFTSLNQAGERITGWSRGQALKMNISDVLAPEYLDVARRMMAMKVAGEPPRIYKVEICDPLGRRVALELSTRLVKDDGKAVGIQGIARDVSDRRRAEEALQSANEKLTRTVRELERRNDESRLRAEIGDLLHTCMTDEEASAVVARAAAQIFPANGRCAFLAHVREGNVRGQCYVGQGLHRRAYFFRGRVLGFAPRAHALARKRRGRPALPSRSGGYAGRFDLRADDCAGPGLRRFSLAAGGAE